MVIHFVGGCGPLARATGGFYFGATEATQTESLRRLGEAVGRYTNAPGLRTAGRARPGVILVDPMRLYSGD
ncbi:hypothetical protein GCM10011608_52350 [Micromonospora sonchi]|uniref:Uncharacterized protein n=1 Tax=Micromonospora sonchi TaxID=1763543 RepID=A0A917U7K4_9ACTN|nr:hypothetical protein [Micromonospora sonchi]GGM60803.1 hypothetical protein GCM10011608_52350 [Micromonospora sonchi]